MLLKALIEEERSAPQVVIVRRAEPILISKSAEIPLSSLPAWKRAGLVATAGILFGLGAAISFGPTHRPAPIGQHWTRVDGDVSHQPASLMTSVETVPLRQAVASTADAVEIEKLKTRNRRLEALVQVLKNRSHEKTQP